MTTESPEPESAKASFGVAAGDLSSPSPGQMEVASLRSEIKDADYNINHLQKELREKENSVLNLVSHLNEMDKRKWSLLKELEKLRHRIDSSNCTVAVEELTKRLELLKVLEREESDLRSVYGEKHAYCLSELELELEKKEVPLDEVHDDSVSLSHSLSDSYNKLYLSKKELAAKLRAMLSLKRQYDDVPAQTELIQYESRLSELYGQVQEKHQQTRKYYDMYNVLLEIKELMLKETSLLNSIDSQFQGAMTSTSGRSKLVDSMEAIVKGAKQKLEKVQQTLLEEQRNCDSLKEKHATAIAEQHHFSSLLRAFQEECSRNEKLQILGSRRVQKECETSESSLWLSSLPVISCQ